MNYSHYLPDTPKRLARFKRMVNGRPVAIVCPGYSSYEFKERIEEFRDFDIVYAGINRWLPLEEDILSLIGKRMSIVFCGAAPDWYIENTCSYLNREDENVFITERLNFKVRGGENLAMLYERYDEKLLLFTSYSHSADHPSKEFPLHFIRQNSLSLLSAIISIAEPSCLIFFGADGGRIGESQLYYKDINEFIHPDQLPPEDSIARDTGWFNRDAQLILDLTKKAHKLGDLKIINCSEKSHLTVFPKLSYDETIEYLRRIC